MTTSPSTHRTGDAVWLGAGAVFCLAAILIGASVGPAGPDWWRVPLVLADHLPLIALDHGVTDQEWNIVWKIRMPRVVLGALVGGMLAMAGSAYQGVFRNPLVDPYLLGAAAGAGLGATAAITLGWGDAAAWPVNPIPASAFIASVCTVSLTYVLGGSFGGSRAGITLVLAGVAVVSFATAAQTFLMQRHLDVIREVFQWILGRLAGATWDDIRLIGPYVACSVVVLLLQRRHLDVFRVGDAEAESLGLSVTRIRLVIVLAATLGTAAVVSVSGLIGFVGLVVPHTVRLLAGAAYRRLIPLSLLVGAGFLVLADVPGRMLTSPAETPIGVVTAFLGAPFFLVLLRSRKMTA